MIGVSIARSTRSGSGDGPGICRKWRPTGREEFFGIALNPGSGVDPRPYGFHAAPGRKLAAMKDECGSQSRLLADLLWRFRHSQRLDLAGEWFGGADVRWRGALARKSRNPVA